MSNRFSNAISSYFVNSIYLVSPSISIPENDLNVAWIHLTGNEQEVIERNMSVPSSWIWNRNIEFMLPSVEYESLLFWYTGIQNTSVSASFRPSMKKEGDISSNEIWDWVLVREECIIFGYDSPETLELCQSSLKNVTIDVVKTDIRNNDHETFPKWNRGGMFHRYNNGKYIGTHVCSQKEYIHKISKKQQNDTKYQINDKKTEL